jgi:hypothetical protein
MSRWRLAILAALIVLPFAFLMAAGSYHIWHTGWTFIVWWPMATSFAIAGLLAWYWQRKRQLLPPVDLNPPMHATERDLEAWKIVNKRIDEANQQPADRLSEPKFYLQTANELALEIARYYHPGTQDLYGNLTVPEILAVAELAAFDLSELVQRYVPGSHLLTINDWKRARSAHSWYKRINNLYWLGSALLNPVETGARFIAARVGLGGTWDLLQQNLLLWFYQSFLHRIGTYLIELHSGRLRVGAGRYRELIRQHQAQDPPKEIAPAIGEQPKPTLASVTIALIGQVKAGKSSLINAMLGDNQALTDALPATAAVTRYRLQRANLQGDLVLLDTVGYGQDGPGDEQIEAAVEAASRADLILLVSHARNPARQADSIMLDQLRARLAQRPDLRMPPVIGVLTHIDLLSPAMEWNPPYDWQNPKRPKEQNIREALLVLREQFADRMAAAVPVCTAVGRIHGIDEALLPAMLDRLSEGRAVALLRCLRDEADEGKFKRLLDQLLAAGKEATRVVWQSVKR